MPFTPSRSCAGRYQSAHVAVPSTPDKGSDTGPDGAAAASPVPSPAPSPSAASASTRGLRPSFFRRLDYARIRGNVTTAASGAGLSGLTGWGDDMDGSTSSTNPDTPGGQKDPDGAVPAGAPSTLTDPAPVAAATAAGASTYMSGLPFASLTAGVTMPTMPAMPSVFTSGGGAEPRPACSYVFQWAVDERLQLVAPVTQVLPPPI